MADKSFSSANKAISIGGSAPRTINAKALLGGMTKDVKRRWTIVAVIGVTAIALAASWASSGRKAPTPKVKDPGVVETTPKGMSAQKDWKAQAGADMVQLRKQLDESQKAQRELAATMDAIRKELRERPAAGSPAPTPPANAGINLNLPPPPEPPKSMARPVPGPTAPDPSSRAPGGQAVATSPATPEVKRSAARAFIPASVGKAPDQPDDTQVEEYAVNERRGFLPAGSFVRASLLSGVEAFTGGTAQSQPQPLVIRLDANAVLPNAAAYQIKGCHVLASVWGDMSSERVFGRLATLTCVDSKDRLVLSEDVEGTLIDSDGKNGIRGELQDRQGAKLARSLLAGFAEGLSTAMGSAQQTVTTTALGATTSVDPSKIMRASSYAGAERAAEQLSEFYLKQAEATMPVIAVDVGRKISVVFTKSKALKFETTDAYRVKPKEKLHIERKVD